MCNNIKMVELSTSSQLILPFSVVSSGDARNLLKGYTSYKRWNVRSGEWKIYSIEVMETSMIGTGMKYSIEVMETSTIGLLIPSICILTLCNEFKFQLLTIWKNKYTKITPNIF